MTLELTTTFRNVSTAGGKPSAGAAAAASAHLRYISRFTAVEDQACSNLEGTPSQQRTALRCAFRNAAEKGGKRGSRVAEKIVITLPNGWPREARSEALVALCNLLAPEGSDAVAYGVTHRDKRDSANPNEHIHIIAIDGAESRDEAIKRNRRGDVRRDEHKHAEAAVMCKPIKTRVKRRNVIRLGDKSRAGEVRADIAGVLNGIAHRRGIEGVEHRSFKDRGMDMTPMIKEGHTVRRGYDPSGRRKFNDKIRHLRTKETAEMTQFLTGGDIGMDEMFTGGDQSRSASDDVEFDRAEAARTRAKEAAMQRHQANDRDRTSINKRIRRPRGRTFDE